MSITVYNKLVCDRIPDIITAQGHTPATRILDRAEHREALFAKLEEEAGELRTAADGGRLEELADLQEVLNALAGSYGYTPSEVAFQAGAKRGLRGGFDGRIYLEYTTHDD
jgi:predicted house-cleaning noncanonical NTP pyrophosphatase (MazG superfamily)